MKILIAILIIAISIIGVKLFRTELEFYPQGQMGNLTPWYTELAMIDCDICGEPTTLYKLDSKGKVWCDLCFRKR